MTQVTTKSGRYYEFKGQKYPSVTTILSKGIPKPGLIKWASRLVATGAIEDAEMWMGWPDEEAHAYLSGLPDAKRNSRANIGSTVHAAAEAFSLGRPFRAIDEEAQSYVNGFEEFVRDFKPKFLHTEAPVFSRTHTYAGTLDSVVRIGRTTYVLDTKTGKRVYPEVALQLSAYAHAEFIGKDDGTEVPLPSIKKGAVLHLFPDGYAFIPTRIDEEVFEAFLSVKDVFHWDFELSKVVLRPQIVKVSQ